ncbi:MAG: hypothetical protein ABI296_08680 [Gammaproteobacteria bacterium]
MSSSGKKLGLDSKKDPNEVVLKNDEVMPEDLVKIIPPDHGIRNIIFDYADDPSMHGKSFSFFSAPYSLERQILSLAFYAGPLDKIELCIRDAYAKKEKHLSDTLILATQLAIINLDYTIINRQGTQIDEGMTERLLKLHKELYPDTFPRALEQARLAAPLEEEKEKIERETDNLTALEKVFDAIKKNDENTAEAIQTFRTFVSDTKPESMTNNKYNLNLTHLLYAAFNILEKRGGELDGRWYGKLGDKFCVEIIGNILQKEDQLSARVQQILAGGLYDLFTNPNNNKPSRPALDSELHATYFDQIGPVKEPRQLGRRPMNRLDGESCFLKFIKSNAISIQNLLYSGSALMQSIVEDTAEVPKSRSR